MSNGLSTEDGASPRSAGGGHARRRVAFLNTHPIQYAAPLYAYLNNSPDIEPVALYLTDFSLRGALDQQFGREVVWDLDLLQGYEHHFVGRNWQTARPEGFFALEGSQLARAIRGGGFSALVVHGHNHLANLVAVAAARVNRIPVLYKAETHLLLPRGGFKAALRPLALKTLFSQVDGFLAISKRNEEFYRSLGYDDRQITLFPYAVDNDRYRAASLLTVDQRRQVRAELDLRENVPTVVYASKFMRRKHPDDLLHACRLLAREGLKLQLLFVGTGEMEDELHRLAASSPELAVRFAGFKNQSELPAVLGACDVFVLPSENEPFGLIINEAMNAGLPVVASEEIGCVPDLVLEGRNGATFQAGDIGGLADALRPIVSDQHLRSHMSEESRRIVADWGYEQDLAGLRVALSKLNLPS